MSPFRKLVPGLVRRYLSRLRFPSLFVLTTLVFAGTVAVPDALPFADEILLGLASLLLGRLRRGEGDGGDGGDDEAGRLGAPDGGSSGGRGA